MKSNEIDTIKFVLGDDSVFMIDEGCNRWRGEKINLLLRNHSVVSKRKETLLMWQNKHYLSILGIRTALRYT